VFRWKEPTEREARTINRARTFLKRHRTLMAAFNAVTLMSTNSWFSRASVPVIWVG
jgi:hypothetical protein